MAFFGIAIVPAFRKSPRPNTYPTVDRYEKSLAQFLVIPATLLIAAPHGLRAQEFFRDFGTSRSSGGLGPIYPSNTPTKMPLRAALFRCVRGRIE